MEFVRLSPLQNPFVRTETGIPGGESDARPSASLFADIFQSAIDNVRTTETVKNDAQYRLATGQLDNPAELSIAQSQWSMSVELLVQLRNSALDAYSELMRISL